MAWSRPIRQLGAGTLASAYLFGLAAIRFGLFFPRDEPSVVLGLKTAQLIGVAVAGLAIALFVSARRTARLVQIARPLLEVS
jgi:prolipoprotein diacylglyceryltransferase